MDRSYKMGSELETGRVFEEDNGMSLWVSDDENQIH